MARLRWLSWDDLDHKDRVERAIEEGLADALKNLLFHNNPINAHFIRVSCRSTAPPANLRLKPKEAFSGGWELGKTPGWPRLGRRAACRVVGYSSWPGAGEIGGRTGNRGRGASRRQLKLYRAPSLQSRSRARRPPARTPVPWRAPGRAAPVPDRAAARQAAHPFGSHHPSIDADRPAARGSGGDNVGRTFGRLGDLDDTSYANQEWDAASCAVKPARKQTSAGHSIQRARGRPERAPSREAGARLPWRARNAL